MYFSIVSRLSIRKICKKNILKTSQVLFFRFYSKQFIQKSIIPTHHFQQSLPKLQIPKLDKTCERFLESIKPVLTENEYSDTKRITTDFLNSMDAQNVHREICSNDAKQKNTSYIAQPWSDMYLKSRNPLVLNYNPYMGIKGDKVAGEDEMLVRAANMIHASALYNNSLFWNVLEPDIYHMNPKKSDTNFFKISTSMLPKFASWYGAYMQNAYPLDMSQYASLFASTRIPCKDKDEIISYWKNSKPRHVIVLQSGRMYKLDIYDENYDIYPQKLIFKALKKIVCKIKSQEKLKKDQLVSALTADERNTWKENRDFLQNEPENAKNLEIVDSALFHICLSTKTATSSKQLTKMFLHNDAGNVWFDKSFTLVFEPGGETGINFEHSWGDGISIVSYFRAIDQHVNVNGKKSHNLLTISDLKNLPLEDLQVEQVCFKLDKEARMRVEASVERFNRYTDQLISCSYESDTLNKKLITRRKISPDAYMQLVFQLATFIQNGKFYPTYESCSTAAFKKGRTETIRSCTNETKLFCESILSKDSTCDLKQLLKNCSIKHGQLTKKAAMGQGFDRHLFAMNHYCKNNYIKLKMFENESYLYNLKHVLSTSTVAVGDQMTMGSFAPVVKNGYGIGYSITNKESGVNITAYKGERNIDDFIECVKKAIQLTASLFTP